MKISRRHASRLVLGAPIAAAVMAPLGSLLGGVTGAAAAQNAAPEPDAGGRSALGRFLSRQEDDLSTAERREIRRSVAQLEQSLAQIRGFVLSNDVPPAGTFRALRSKR